MLINQNAQSAFSIKDVTTCDFSQLDKLDNEQVLAHIGNKGGDKIHQFIDTNIGIKERYWCKEGQNSLDLARSALQQLIHNNPEIVEQADFLIYAGISNPYPVTTLSTLLADEFGFKNTSCWDIKSGCSTALFALLQGVSMLSMGSTSGIIVSAENLSRFSNPKILQMSIAIGDGAAAMYINTEPEWKIKSSVHGTNAQYSGLMRVNCEFPTKPKNEDQSIYYEFSNKPEGIEKLQHHWLSSLKQTLELANLSGPDISHYIAHQVDATKNRLIAEANNINEAAMAFNFELFGNMGSPTLFINYENRVKQQGITFSKGEHLLFHVVGGGISWAGLCLEYMAD